MFFDTRVAGIPCQYKVIAFRSETPMRVNGPAFEDSEPAIEEVFEFDLFDRKGYPAIWLEKKLTPADHDRILEEYLTSLNADYFNPY